MVGWSPGFNNLSIEVRWERANFVRVRVTGKCDEDVAEHSNWKHHLSRRRRRFHYYLNAISVEATRNLNPCTLATWTYLSLPTSCARSRFVRLMIHRSTMWWATLENCSGTPHTPSSENSQNFSGFCAELFRQILWLGSLLWVWVGSGDSDDATINSHPWLAREAWMRMTYVSFYILDIADRWRTRWTEVVTSTVSPPLWQRLRG